MSSHEPVTRKAVTPLTEEQRGAIAAAVALDVLKAMLQKPLTLAE
jgi:hypothetical protein